ncbi:MAG TPA: hypothetical protein VMW67_05835 [Desulfobacteria bacterium]|nr:hypothetical protein [Desulfobacteria bacterium]
MDALYNALKEIGTEEERKVKAELSGSSGPIKILFYNLITPLVLNFETERERYHFIFQKGGSVSVCRGLHNNPDVIVSGAHAELLYLLQSHDKERFKIDEQTRKVKIRTRTFKGRQTVTKLRELFL